jgi:hypothetical protein
MDTDFFYKENMEFLEEGWRQPKAPSNSSMSSW